MEGLWQQIEAKLEKLSPDLLSRLHPGVVEQALFQVEELLGRDLPEDIKAFFRQHNGSVGPFFVNGLYFPLKMRVSNGCNGMCWQ